VGLQDIGKKKVQDARRGTHLNIIRLMRHSNRLWFGWVQEREGHWHVEIDPVTWDWDYHPRCGFSSCRDNTYGPGVVPSDPHVLERHQERAEERIAAGEEKAARQEEMIDAYTKATKEQFEALGFEVIDA